MFAQTLVVLARNFVETAKQFEIMAKKTIRKQDALAYHMEPVPGKVEVIPTKSSKTQRDLALAYSPGVAEPCIAIAENPEDVYKYTSKGNLVAVISNGTAVLGLGNIGAAASKPVMEGKSILFKIFAGLDCFDLELDVTDTTAFIQVVKALEPTFGGINLEDIKAPDCFEIERELKKALNIPVMHDDQHGTAIIAGAALLNALDVVADKKIENIRVVVSGAGASALTCTKIFIELGVRKQNIIVCDSKGVIRTDRVILTPQKKEVATNKDFYQLADALMGADVFLGLSRGNIVSEKMLASMAKDPIVFALANPEPEINYALAKKTRQDVIMATGRSDHPNQVNNVLGFPFIFRGAMDVRATEINEEMKLAAVRAIANLAKKNVPEVVNKAYGQENITFGRDYIIPKPLDPRLLTTVTPAVARAAMATGVAQKPIADWEAYTHTLIKRMGADDHVIRSVINKAKQLPKRIVFTEAEDPRILQAVQIALDEGICEPVLLGRPNVIQQLIETYKLDLGNIEIINPRATAQRDKRARYAKVFFDKRQRKGYNWLEAQVEVKKKSYFGMLMVQQGDADGLLSGITGNYAEIIKPALQVIGVQKDVNKVASMYMMLTKRGPLFFADTTMITEPTAEELAEIALLVAKAVKNDFSIEPVVAMLSYAIFGSVDGEEPNKVRKAVEMLKKIRPTLTVDGEIQANFVF